MSEREKTIAENIAKACALLPENKKEYLLGFAEGVAAVAGDIEEMPDTENPAPGK